MSMNHSQNISSRHKCLKCGKTFIYKIGYLKHIQKHEVKDAEIEATSTLLVSVDKSETETKENSIVGSLKPKTSKQEMF